MMKFEIDKNIPIPTVRRGGYLIYPFSEMEVGDSFFVDDLGKGTALRNAACNYARRHGKRFTVQAEKDGLRCWRIE